MRTVSALWQIESDRYSSHVYPQDFDGFKQLTARWFLDGTAFDSMKWAVVDSNRKFHIDFSGINIAPNTTLCDDAELLFSVKLSVYLLRVCSNRNVGRSASGEAQKSHLSDMVLFIRFLKMHNINNLYSLNDSLVKAYLSVVHQPAFLRLNALEAVKKILESYSDEKLISEFAVARANRIDRLPEFNYTKLMALAGFSERMFSSSSECTQWLDSFKRDKGFIVNTSSKFGKSRKDPGLLKSDTIRKHLTSISKFMNQCVLFCELFPERHRVNQNFITKLTDKKITKFSKSVGCCEASTRDIPKDIFFDLMDKSIRWVVDYSESLIQLRGEAQDRFLRYINESELNSSKSEDAHHLASKRMRQWLSEKNINMKEFPGSPYPLSGFVKNSRRKSRANRVFNDQQLQQIKSMRDHGDTLKSIADVFGTTQGTVSRVLSNGYADNEGVSLDKAVHGFLPTACLLVIYCFTARRECEVEGLEAGCCTIADQGPVIDMYSAKYLRVNQTFPTTLLVKKAVDVLEKLSAPCRNEKNNSILTFPYFEKTAVNGENFRRYWSSGKINEFCDFLGVKNDDGKPWLFSEHQFRRFFSMMYFWRWDKGDLATLSWYLRHTDFETTKEYLVDSDGRRAFEDVKREKLIEIANRSSNAESNGEVIHEIKSLIDSVDIAEAVRAEKIIKKRFDEIGFVVDFARGAVCVGRTPKYREKANCYYQGAPQISSASESMCNGCPCLLEFNESQALDDIEGVFCAGKSPMLQAVKQRVGEL